MSKKRGATNGLELIAGHWLMSRTGWDALRAIAERSDMPSPQALEAKLGEWLRGSWQTTVRDGVATIPVRGPLFHHASWLTLWLGWSTYDSIAQDVRQATDDPAIKSTILAVNTPGGLVSGVSECADVIRRCGEIKPIDAHVSGEAASAGYWLTAAARRVWTSDVGMLGCLGTMWSTYDFSDYERKLGIQEITIISSQTPRKNPDPATKAGRSEFQALADELADVFLNAMAEYRGKSREQVDADFGAGALLIGQSAVDAGLADRVGTYEELLAELATEDRSTSSVISPGATMKTKPSVAGGASAATPSVQAEDTNTEKKTCSECGAELNADGTCPNGHAQSTSTTTATGSTATAQPAAPAAAAQPAAPDAIESATKAERQRITEIRALNGSDAIKDKAIEDGISPAEAALRINKAQGTQATSKLAAIQKDDAGPHASAQPGDDAASKTPAAAAKASVDQYLALTGRGPKSAAAK